MLKNFLDDDRTLVAAALWSAATTHTVVPTALMQTVADAYRDR